MKKKTRSQASRAKAMSNIPVRVMMLMFFIAFFLIALKKQINAQEAYDALKAAGDPSAVKPALDLFSFALCLIVPIMIFIGTVVLGKLLPTDPVLLSLTNFLCALGVFVLYSTAPDKGLRQCMYYGIGIGVMALCIYLVRIVKHWRTLSFIVFPIALLLLATPLVLGTEQNGAKNWIYIGGTSLQPSELVKIPLLILLAYYMSRRKFFSWMLFCLIALAVLMLQKDLGTALLYYITALLLYYASTGNLPVSLVGLGGGAGAAYLGYTMFAHVKKRVALWLNPWSDYDAGYQIIHSLVAIASGGLFGMGVGLGSPKSIPIYYTDFIFAVICEQFGMLFGFGVILVYVFIMLRGVSAAMDARNQFDSLLAMGATIILSVQAFIIIGGVIKLIPLTGVTMPFVSYGGTSMLASMGIMGLLQGVASKNKDALIREESYVSSAGEVSL
ncbi:MAG: FtsW/RodA/SpoVE family cell cycle protein [Eubacteriales bacterium]|nr:FtsW/RodA/SpoVE family cell cycle protein [Eubacteriales bacterium]MDD3882717.1 FtsW/RodA/SpoVE family cell cycle protein [Eubacteriales bacterium]MDD4512662.1 FtsW/RodA/SpoVE family cell cycle protein [Eubacteriales bacterium]